MLTEKILLVDRCYLSPAAMAAAHLDSYRLLHEPRLNIRRVACAVGGAMIGGSVFANVPAGVVIGLGIIVWGVRG